jgi:hypothetical protein
MSAKAVFLYLLVLVLGAAVGVGRSYYTSDLALVFPDVILSALLYAVLAVIVLITAHLASRWGGEGADIDLDIGE